jgi:hypothetical protein
MPEDHTSKRGRGLFLPGQPTEEAVAEVGSEAGKSLVRGLGKLGNASVSEWTTKREATAEAARLAIETDAAIKANSALVAARREQELAELEHQAALQRRAERLRIELAREQRNLEAIERRALEFAERDPNNSKPRELDEDWLFKFADFAQKISDADVQSLWARALSSAAIEGASRLSAAALQTLGLFDRDIAENFRKFVAAASRFGFVPYTPDGRTEPQQIDLTTLMDLGLIQGYSHEEPYDYEDFAFEPDARKFKAIQSQLGFTKRGYDIANAVFPHLEELPLSEEHEQKYLVHLLLLQMESQPHVTILPKLGRPDQPLAIRLTNKNDTNSSNRDWKTPEAAARLSQRLLKLLAWAEQNYDIEIK